ncbi:hypothetical protein B0H34DRAFT_645950 [Crassisporium funariophilum]|nr:hypothetical protein B0H34DRAFT_645950 [Crassisporium funariophilum]
MHREIPRDVDATFAYLQNNDGEEYDSHHHSGHDGCSQGPHIDIDEAVRNAVKHGSGESSLFESALGYLSDKKHKHEPLDKEHVTNAFEQAYSQGAAGNLSANSMGSAAALNVLKQITSGGQSSGSGFGSLTQLISLAMAEATKLFDKSGRATSGDKQDAVNGAAMTMMKIFFQSKFSEAVGGGNSGSPGGLMSLVGLLSLSFVDGLH